MDHPRIRGEHDVTDLVFQREVGIIPAYAGSTLGVMIAAADESGSSPHTRGAHAKELVPEERLEDHPRIRGEHMLHQLHLALTNGIIPAYAGSTQTA